MTPRDPIKVLLIDDDPEDLELTEEVLAESRRLRFEVTLESDPKNGVELLCNEKFDVALIDFRMGQTDGLSVLGEARERGCQSPVIMLTGHDRDSLAEEALTAGVTDYLQKGKFDASLLERTILYAIERMRSFQRLDQAASRLRFILEATPGFAWEVDHAGKLLFASKRWRDDGGFEHDVPNLFDLVHPEDRDSVLASWNAMCDSDQEWRAEYRIFSQDGSPIWVSSRATRGEGRVESPTWVGLTVSVDEQKRTELDLKLRVDERTSELQYAQRELESVSYSMSHDMRAPVRAIIATSTEMIEDFPQAEPALIEGLKRQRQVGKRMHGLVDGMIRYIRLIRTPLALESLDASDLCHDIFAELRFEDGLYDASFEIEPDLLLHGDSAVTRMLVKALLENAAKFRGSDRPNRILIGSGSTPNSLRIRDDGIGFDMKYLNKVLLPFERLHRENEYPGVGIGLAIARRAASRHGGDLNFTASPGRGTQVEFTLGPESP